MIGNGAYKEGPLRNPVNDDRMMRNLLRKAGFSVTMLENARKNELVNAIRSLLILDFLLIKLSRKMKKKKLSLRMVKKL